MLEVEPDLNIPFVSLRDIDKTSIPERAKALWATVDLLKQGAFADGDDITSLDQLGVRITDEDYEEAESTSLQLAAGEDPPAPAPPVMLLVGNIIEQYSHRVVDDAEKIRETIKNKLIIEIEHPDARVRLRALEMLGKINDVGAFTERTEVTHKNHPSDISQMRELLFQKLSAMVERKEKEVPAPQD